MTNNVLSIDSFREKHGCSWTLNYKSATESEWVTACGDVVEYIYGDGDVLPDSPCNCGKKIFLIKE